MRRALVVVAVLLTGCAGGHGTTPTRGSTGTTPSARLSVRVAVPSRTMVAGSTMAARITVDNDVGHAVKVIGCGSLFQVLLSNARIHPSPVWPTCAEVLTVRAGKSSYTVPVAASYLGCGGKGAFPACTDGRPPPLPPGGYLAKLFQNPSVAPTPRPIAIRVVP